MKVFISWSGDLSLKVASALRDWLPSVIQSLEPYVSSEDIDKGARWSTDIAKELEDSSFGILCITKENLDAAWLNFEAGALSKSVDRSRVSPFLFGVKRSEVKGPILQFQSTTFEKDDVKKLIISLNSAEDESAVEEARLDNIFEVWWPQLKEQLDRIEIAKSADSSSREKVAVEDSSPSSEILEEVLELVRQQHRLLNSPESLLPVAYVEHVLRRTRGLRPNHPAYRELDEHWQEFEVILNSFEAEDTIPASVVREVFSKLQFPVLHILQEGLRGSRFPTRVRRALDLPE